MPHRIALVDDHHMVRDGIAATIGTFPDFTVSIEVSNGAELIEALTVLPAPAIAIVDLHMPVMDGYETIAWLNQHHPEILPLALTFDTSDEAMVKAVRAGARGFLRKNARSAILKLALDSLMLTGYFQMHEAHHGPMNDPSLRTEAERERDQVLERVTPRERELLRLVCDGRELTYDQIAEHMGISRNTVENYRVSLFEKFGIGSKTGLVLFAKRWGLAE